MSKPLNPTAGLLAKLAAAIVHAEDYSARGHGFDLQRFRTSVEDPEVQDWLAAMTKLGMAPVKRRLPP